MESVKNMIPMNLKSHTIHRTLTHMTRRMKEIKIDVVNVNLLLQITNVSASHAPFGSAINQYAMIV